MRVKTLFLLGKYEVSSELCSRCTVHQLFIDFKKANDSAGREVLYNILIEFGVPIKLVRLNKICLTL
jgi:hypothetical protein